MTAYHRFDPTALAPALLFASLAAILPMSAPAGAETPRAVSGEAGAVDGRTLVIDRRAFRLIGIDVPDLGQTCERFGKAYPCGNVARTALIDLITGTKVRCVPVAGEPNQRSAERGATLARCSATGVDLSWNMVHTGWAIPDGAAGERAFARVAARARSRKAGLWKGTFVRPKVWRAAVAGRRGAKATEQCFRGRLLGGGPDCQSLQVGRGRTVTLAGPGVAAKPGGMVCACGTYFRQMTTACGTRPTLVPYKVGHEADCPR